MSPFNDDEALQIQNKELIASLNSGRMKPGFGQECGGVHGTHVFDRPSVVIPAEERSSQPRQRAEAEVTATSVRIKTSVAIELAVRQGVEDSLTEWEAQFLSEPLPESALPSRQRDEIINRVTDAVTMSIANLIDFGEDE